MSTLSIFHSLPCVDQLWFWIWRNHSSWNKIMFMPGTEWIDAERERERKSSNSEITQMKGLSGSGNLHSPLFRTRCTAPSNRHSCC